MINQYAQVTNGFTQKTTLKQCGQIKCTETLTIRQACVYDTNGT